MKVKDLKIESEEIVLGGKKLNLNLDMNALVELEDIYGDINIAFENFKTKPMKEMRTFLYAMLKTQIKDLTIESIGNLITVKNFNDLFGKISNIIYNAFPTTEQKDEENVEKKSKNV